MQLSQENRIAATAAEKAEQNPKPIHGENAETSGWEETSSIEKGYLRKISLLVPHSMVEILNPSF